ncbi:hypothetical protein TW95_gp0431 [Pandoravirus inopinatum]|uniref:Uncharacterized protein n=1 Tax=Pandoravirus inopinatum TaxID=1605721 RepID=A0A0B5J644_9VIRU|nr:hypothetical protein TW95_gp0431 [Pandoravirus inopinatum]AJF97165.1 hypothetical protein [Pandoravirus inopinatum]
MRRFLDLAMATLSAHCRHGSPLTLRASILLDNGAVRTCPFGLAWPCRSALPVCHYFFGLVPLFFSTFILVVGFGLFAHCPSLLRSPCRSPWCMVPQKSVLFVADWQHFFC